MFLKNSPVKRTLLVLLLLVIAVVIFHKQIIAWYINPPDRFAVEQIPTAPDYAKLQFWSAHPDQLDSSNLAPVGSVPIDPKQANVDVFYIQPTTHFTGGQWNSDMSTLAFAEQGTEHIIATTASVFSSCCRIFAPRYRQAHLAAFIETGSEAAIKALDLAYVDVEQAFQHFLSNRNPARPFIVASHSQGTLHGLRLLSTYVDGKDLQNDMIAAYLIGYWMPADVLSVTLPNTPLCENENMTGCLITYDTYDVDGTGRDPDGVLPYWYPTGWEWANRPKTLCVNPLSWTVSGGKVPASENLGALPMQWTDAIGAFLQDKNPGFVYDNLGEPKFAYTSATCLEDGSLVVDSQAGSKFDNRGAGPDRSLHPNDWNFFHMNLRQNAAQRITAFKSVD